MSHYWHWLLLAVALVLNWGDRRALALTLVIGLSLIIPVNQFTTRADFYIACVFFELLVVLCALHIDTRASSFVILMCLLLSALHLVGWNTGGHKPDSPYRLLAKIAEYAEIIACILFATPLMRLLKK